MADRYQQLINTPIGQIVSKQVGLPSPVKLERYEPGQPVIDGPVLLGAAPGSALADRTAEVLSAIGADVVPPGESFKALVFDATGIASSEQLNEAWSFFHPRIRQVRDSGRVIVLGTAPEACEDPRRGDRPARARGPRPLDRQGGPPRRHRPAALPRTPVRRDRVDAALLPLAEVGVRLRPGRADRRPRDGGREGRLGAAAERQGGARHRRRARDRCGDRRGARARRRPRRRARRPRPGRRAERRHEPAERLVADARHHRRGGPGHDRRSPARAPRRRRRRSSTTPASPATRRSGG